MEDRYGPDHPHVALALSSLGHVLQQLGDQAAATEHLQRAVAIKRAAYGPDHPWTRLASYAATRLQHPPAAEG